MSILTYLPAEKNGFFLTFNREVHSDNLVTIPPRKYNIAGKYVFFSRDSISRNMWVGSSYNLSFCIISRISEESLGETHTRYCEGDLIANVFKFEDITDFLAETSFHNFQPFVLIIAQRTTKGSLHEILWDGKQVIHNKIPKNEPHCWTSLHLEQNENSGQVVRDFEEKKTFFNQKLILKFHKTKRKKCYPDTANQLITQSITQFFLNDENFTIHYEDLFKKKIYNFRIFPEGKAGST